MDNLPLEPSTSVTEDQLVNMSDEQFHELDFSSLEQGTAEASEQEADAVEETDNDDEPPLEAPDVDDVDDGAADLSANDADVLEESTESADEADEQEDDTAKAEQDDKPDTDEPAADIDYKAEYEKVLAPFNANGKEMRVDNADDAIRLMQMGANYVKKMAALKPNLKLLKMLENNKLLSEEKLSYYIDLENKNPEAIKKFIKESGVDPLDLDLDGKNEYTPGNHSVDDRAVDLELALEEIKDTPTYSKTMNVVAAKWDKASKETIYEQPKLLSVINDHIASGVYDVISNEVERERVLGRLTGLSDLEAYHQVGDAIQARGGFNHLFKAPAPTEPVQPKTVVKKAAQPKVAAPNQKLNQQRRAASPTTRSAADSGPSPDFNPLALSDAEFEKMNGLPN